jgi:heme oxygenase
MEERHNRFVLRDATRSEHQVLDSMIGHFGDKRSYLHYLIGMAAFRGCVEPALGQGGLHRHFGDWRPTEVLAHVQRDIIDLDGDPVDEGGDFAWPANLGTQAGILYVLEGSALGARVLTRRAAALGYSDTFGARHLAQQTSRADAWPRFVSLLDTLPEAHIDDAIAGARMTFLAALDAFGELVQRERAG